MTFRNNPFRKGGNRKITYGKNWEDLHGQQGPVEWNKMMNRGLDNPHTVSYVKDILKFSSSELSIENPLFLLLVRHWKNGHTRISAGRIFQDFFIEDSSSAHVGSGSVYNLNLSSDIRETVTAHFKQKTGAWTFPGSLFDDASRFVIRNLVDTTTRLKKKTVIISNDQEMKNARDYVEKHAPKLLIYFV